MQNHWITVLCTLLLGGSFGSLWAQPVTSVTLGVGASYYYGDLTEKFEGILLEDCWSPPLP